MKSRQEGYTRQLHPHKRGLLFPLHAQLWRRWDAHTHTYLVEAVQLIGAALHQGEDDDVVLRGVVGVEQQGPGVGPEVARGPTAADGQHGHVDARAQHTAPIDNKLGWMGGGGQTSTSAILATKANAVWGLCGGCVGAVWELCGSCMGAVWGLCGSCMRAE